MGGLHFGKDVWCLTFHAVSPPPPSLAALAEYLLKDQQDPPVDEPFGELPCFASGGHVQPPRRGLAFPWSGWVLLVGQKSGSRAHLAPPSLLSFMRTGSLGFG